MFSLFKKKSPLEKLEKEHKKILKEAFELSSVNRTKSDEKMYEAEQIATKLQELRGGQKTA
ncbi:Lacal_2735 family protein [Wenyingzhuangia sp. IMCC45574]